MKSYLSVLCVVACILLLAQVSVAQNDDSGVKFKWGFAAKVGPTDGREFVSVTHDTMMHNGDSLRMVVELEKMCYVYVLYQASNGDLALMFPYSLSQFTKDYAVGKNYFVPKGRGWNQLDTAVGKERFYVLASPTRLSDFEVSYTKYLAAKGTSKKDMASKVISQIRNTKRQFKSYAAAAERPINIGGNVRGLVTPEMKPPDVTDVEIQISGQKFYSKTFTIDHRQ